ncbi:MAG: winged helix-turn-helix domain-containing protein [Promethearchaeota archaeon]
MTGLLQRTFGLTISQERVRQVLHELQLSYKQALLQPPIASPAEKKRRKQTS